MIANAPVMNSIDGLPIVASANDRTDCIRIQLLTERRSVEVAVVGETGFEPVCRSGWRFSRPQMVKHNANAGMALSADQSSAFDIVRRSRVRFAVIKNERRRLVIGSDALAKVIPRGVADLSNSDSYQWLPIAYEIAVAFASIPGGGELIETVDGQFDRTVNKATFRQST